MCKKLVFILTLSLCLMSSVDAATVTWDFENENGHGFNLWSVQGPGLAIDDPTIAGDESLTGIGGPSGLPDAGVAWTVGQPNQFDGLKPPVATGARVDGNGLLNYSLGTEDIPAGSGTLNTYNLNQDGDYLNSTKNDQIATSPPVLLSENAVLTVKSYGGGTGTHAPAYDPDPAMMYTDGSSGIAVLSAEGDDIYAILATVHIQSQGTLSENTLDLSAFAGRKVFIEIVDAIEGNDGWLAIDEIQITNAISKTAGLLVQLVEDEPTMGFDLAQIDRLQALGYNVLVISQDDVRDGTFSMDDANAFDILVVSESPSSSATVSLAGTSTPVMHQEAYGWQREWAFTSQDDCNWRTGSEVEIVNDTHPIVANAGLGAGPMTFFDPANSWTTNTVSSLAPGAELLAKITDAGVDHAIIFAIEKGALLANGQPAASRLVGFSLPGTTPTITADVMTDEAWALYDAAIQWMDPTPVPPTAAMVVSNTDLTAGFDQAQKDRLESLGYEVTVTTGSDVKNDVFTVADAETYDVLVVSESIGSADVNKLIGVNVPMMHQESYGWSRHYFTAGLKKAWIPVDGPIDIVSDHAIIADAGLSAGPLDFFTAPTNATSDLVSALAPGAVNLAQVTSDANDFTLVFAIEKGAELSNGTPAANRVVGFSLPGTEPAIDASVMTNEAWAFFDAAIRWLDAAD